MSQKPNRIIGTLFSALSDLALSRDIRKIRVSDICEQAGIHRATFYRHLENTHDLLERGTEIFWDNLVLEMEECRKVKNPHPGAAPEYLHHFFNCIMLDKTVFQAFLLHNSSNYFQSNMRSRMADFLHNNRLPNIRDSGQRKQVVHMISAALYATVELMIQDDEYLPYLNVYYRFAEGVLQFQ